MRWWYATRSYYLRSRWVDSLLLFIGCRSLCAEGVACQSKAMMALHNAIEDGVGNGGVADPGMPMVNRQLTRNDRGFIGRAVVNDFQEIGSSRAVDGAHAPVVQDQHIGFG